MSDKKLYLTVLLLDTSGSMEGSKLFALRQACAGFVKRYYDWERRRTEKIEAELAIISFSDQADVILPMSPINAAAKVVSVESLVASGGTHLAPALTACDELLTARLADVEERRAIQTSVILASDGYPRNDYEQVLRELTVKPHWIDAARFSISIGVDADLSALERFNNHSVGVIENPSAVSIPESFDLICRAALEQPRAASKISNKQGSKGAQKRRSKLDRFRRQR